MLNDRPAPTCLPKVQLTEVESGTVAPIFISEQSEPNEQSAKQYQRVEIYKP